MHWIKKTIKPLCLAITSVALMHCATVDETTLFKEKVNESLSHYYRGLELRVKKDFVGAEAEFKQSVEISPRPRTYLALAEISMAQEKLNDAEQYTDQALRLSPNLSVAKDFKKQILIRKGVDISTLQSSNISGNDLPARNIATPLNTDIETQIQPVQESVQTSVIEPKTIQSVTEVQPAIQPLIISPELKQAKDAANSGNWAEAEQLASQIIKEQPENSEAFYLLGYIHFQQKNYEEAEQAFRQTIRLDSNHANALNDLGITLEYVGRSAEAVEYYERAVKTGTNPDAFFNLALLEEKRGQYAKAISLYERYLQKDQSSAFSDFAKERIVKLRRVEY